MNHLGMGHADLGAVSDPDRTTVVVRVEGDLDTYTAAAFNEHVGSRAHAARLLVIDLSRVDLLDGVGVRALCAQARAGRQAGRRVVVLCPDGPVRRALAVATLDEPLAVVSDIHEMAGARPMAVVERSRLRTPRVGNYVALSGLGSGNVGRGPDARPTRFAHRLSPTGDHTGRHP